MTGFNFFMTVELPEHLADLWLESLARGTMHHYSEQILKVLELSSLGTKQLITDIGNFVFTEFSHNVNMKI